MFKALIFIILFLFQSSVWAQAISCNQLLVYNAGLSSVVKKNSFVTSRDLSEYMGGFHSDFKNSLSQLKNSDVWVDLGAGKGKAAEQYFQEFSNPQQGASVVLIAYKLDRWFGISDFSGKLQVMEGRLLEEIPLVQIPKARLMTDFYGVLSYTRDLSRSLNVIFDRLEIQGELYVHSSHMHTLIESGEKVMSLEGFLKEIPGIKVEGKWGILKITKLKEDIAVPNLKLTRLNEEEKPPLRRFSPSL